MAPDPLPMERTVPPVSAASPAELRDADGAVSWWMPSWRDAVRQVGWRWIFLAPAVLMFALFVGAVFLRGLRAPLLMMGGQVAVFVGAIALTMAGWVIRRAARARREPFCIHCGYNLSGLPDDYRCPECGRPYTWRLIEEYRRDPQWFIERWKLHRELPRADVPFDAGPVRRKPRDGTA
jgi:hypothetical protein